MISMLKLIRRRVTFWSILGLVFVCLIFTYSHQNSKIQDSSSSEDRVVRKRLQTIDSNVIEPVQFIPGVPGHNRVSGKEAANHDGAYAFRNKIFQDNSQSNVDPLVGQTGREAVVPQVISYQENLEYDSKQGGNYGQMSNGIAAPIYYNNQGVQTWNSGQAAYNNQQNQGLLNTGELYPSSSLDGKPYVPKHRIVHFDLKGAPPKASYIKKVLLIVKDIGATGVLWEWEDTFPFTGRLEVAATSNHYTLDEVHELLELCRQLGLESIPLVQTFGHMEFILKLQQFQHLRDHPEMPESICPCMNETIPLIKDYIDQVMAVHTDAKYLHIGCDEVYHLGTCQPCMDRPRNNIFVEHVTKVANYASARYGVKPIIWDDMLRNFMEDEMMPLANIVEPMVWVYAEDVYRFMPSFNWDKFSAVFPFIWTASAFKGAHGETLVVPDAKRHLVNQLNWLEVMRQEENKFTGGFKGIVLTGWQRFDHFSVLCELFASGFPSLVLDLLAVTHGYYNTSLFPEFFSALQCPHKGAQQVLNLDSDNFMWSALSWCNFPGSSFFRVTEQLVALEKETNEFFKMAEKKKGWFTQYSKDHNFGSAFRIDQIFEDWSRYQHQTSTLMRKANTALKEVYDHHTQGEWVEQKLYPIYKKLSKMRQEADELKTVRSWVPRPFPIPQALLDMGIGVPPTTTTSTTPPPPQAADPSRGGVMGGSGISLTARGKRRVQSPDLYSSRGRLKHLGHRRKR